MQVTIDGITYEGTEAEIRRIVENPPTRPRPQVGDCPDNDSNSDGKTIWILPCQTCPMYPSITRQYPVYDHRGWPDDCQKNWDGSPSVTCYSYKI